MKKILSACFVILTCFWFQIFAQIPATTLVQIVKAEDELRYDKTLEGLMKHADAKIRVRAALAAGRIGNETAIPALASLLENDSSVEVRTMAAFALGETESIKAADAILNVLQDMKYANSIRARAVEAAGKIAAANAKEEKSKALGDAILKMMNLETSKSSVPDTTVVMLGLTAILRARPAGADALVRSFLAYTDPRIRADALNTLARLRAQNVNRDARDLLVNDVNAVVRANAARVLGAAVAKDAFDVLLNAALKDADSRVRVSAIRSLASLQDAKAAEKLLERGATLLTDYKKSKSTVPAEKNELLEIATTLGRILLNTKDERAVKFLNDLREAGKYQAPEVEIALARIAPETYLKSVNELNAEKTKNFGWQEISSLAQGMGELANASNEDVKKEAAHAANMKLVGFMMPQLAQQKPEFIKALPDALRSFAAFKTADAPKTLINHLTHQDVIVRATAAELLGEQEPTKENIAALTDAFLDTENDKLNDASLAILDALGKQYSKIRPSDPSALVILRQFQYALDSPDYLVRRRAITTLKSLNLMGDITARFELVRFPLRKTDLASELRVVRADYAQAVSRKNGQVKAVVTTDKGLFTIDLLPEDAPLTVDNFIKLAKSGYFNGLTVHRVVPNFVMQDGDPRGDGNGGPGWQIRCEINMVPYERGAVGMALSGKDTGGSQWFVTHSPQPHLDGGYTVFGRVNETEMKIVDAIARGDKILSIRIVEATRLMLNTGKKQKPKTKK